MNTILKILETIGKVIVFIALCIFTTPIGAILITIAFTKLSNIEENTRAKRENQESIDDK